MPRTSIRQLFAGGLVIIAAGALAGCGDRSETDTAQEFVSAFNEGALADHKYGLFSELLTAGQLRTLTELGERCTIDPDSVAVVETRITPYLKTFGAIADCDGTQYSVITGVARDCQSGQECEGDFRINPRSLPGGPNSGRIKNTSLPAEIRELDPLEPSTK